MCGIGLRSLLALSLLLLSLSSGICSAEAVRPLTQEERAAMLDELIANSDELKKINDKLTLDNQSLSVQLMLASQSLQVMRTYSGAQASLLTETRTLLDDYARTQEGILSTTRIELWAWRIAAGVFAGLMVWAAVK